MNLETLSKARAIQAQIRRIEQHVFEIKEGENRYDLSAELFAKIQADMLADLAHQTEALVVEFAAL